MLYYTEMYITPQVLRYSLEMIKDSLLEMKMDDATITADMNKVWFIYKYLDEFSMF